jgi:uncharacterized RDD family membrane protein YckC
VTSQPGWHPDPVPLQPGQPAQLRYWDGGRWTEHTAPAQPPATAPYATTGASGVGGAAAYDGTYGAVQHAPAGYAYGVKAPPVTPDGVPLAGWWQRVLATLVDGLILLPITLVLYIPFYGKVFDAYRDYFHDLDRASAGGPQPSPFQVERELAGTLTLMGLVSLALGLVWTFFWLRWKQATPGKLVLGLRVRRRDVPGPLPWSTIALRWLGQYAVGVLALVPVVGSILGIYSVLDDLWPLWDDKRQALHDKVAGTNVVRIR